MKQKGFAPTYILLGFLILAVVGGGAYYFGKISNNPVPSPTPGIIKTGPTKVVDETADWKTYTSADFKFSFRVSKDERVISCPNKNEFNDNIAVWITDKPKVADSNFNECATEGPDKMIFVNKQSTPTAVNDYLRQLQAPGNDYNLSVSDTTISGIVGKKVTGERDSSRPAPVPDKINKTIVLNNGIFYVIDNSFLSINFQIIN